MYPPVFSLAFASSAVKAVFGTTPCRIYPFGEAPAGVAKPYAVWQSVTISPENYLNAAPDMDAMSAQIDVYADTAASARSSAQELRDLYQATHTVTAMREFPKEAETNLCRYQLEVDFWTSR